MSYYVYMLLTVNSKTEITYVGYSTDPLKRLDRHNRGVGAKFTKGRMWKIIYKKKLKTKGDALRFEYFLKKNIKLRKTIKDKNINEH